MSWINLFHGIWRFYSYGLSPVIGGRGRFRMVENVGLVIVFSSRISFIINVIRNHLRRASNLVVPIAI